MTILILVAIGCPGVVGSAAGSDFRVQRGTAAIEGGSSTLRLDAGLDYVAPTGPAFVRLVGTRNSGMGRTSGGGTQSPERWMVWIEEAGQLDSFFLLGRYGTLDDTRVAWEIVEYVGLIGDPDELVVHGTGTVPVPDLASEGYGDPVVGVADDADVVVLVTGQAVDEGVSAEVRRGLFTAGWDGASAQPAFRRGSSGSAATVSYVVLEFVGQDWNVWRVEHAFLSAGAVETESIPIFKPMDSTFFFAQHRSGGARVDQQGAEIWLSGVGEVGFRLQEGTQDPGTVAAVAWILSNEGARVEHVAGFRDTGGFEEDAWTVPVTAVSPSSASVVGENSRCSGTTEFPGGSIIMSLADTSRVELRQSRSDLEQTFRFSVLQWPGSAVVGDKGWALAVDGDASGDPTPGDVIRYTIGLGSSGIEPVILSIVDEMPSQAASWSLVEDGGGTDGSTPGALVLDDVALPPGGTVEIVFDVVLAEVAGDEAMINVAQYTVAPDGETGEWPAPPVPIRRVSGVDVPDGRRRPVLGQNTPNPFNPTTRIRFEVVEDGPVRLAVFDVTGRHVVTLVDGMKRAGMHETVWDGRNGEGRPMASGTYFYQLDAGGQLATKRMALLK